ncbi:MAG TPA: XRE family transcriptional regulator [Polyangiaceae bacterium]|nr:XRE family transcriptional regulator [Polyangiaceae bacterium]
MGDRIALNLAANVRRLREERGHSQQQMADVSGVPRPTWANLESGDANPTVSVLTKVADALQVGIEDLLTSRETVTHFAARSLPERSVGRARVRKLVPPSPIGEGQTASIAPGLEVERIDLPAAGEITGKPHASGTREYLTCEKGELELSAGGQIWKLRSGDVIAFRSEAPYSYKNTGRTQAIAYSIVTFAPVRG